MFFQILFIHLFRPFLKYKQSTSPLPAHVSPRKFCTQAASTISKLFRLYKRTYGVRQIVNIAVYILHSACTIHLLNLPEKNAERDIVHGLKHLEEISESWLCARKTLAILQASSRRWNIQLPKEAEKILDRADVKFQDQLSPKSENSQPQPHHNSMPSLATSQEAVFAKPANGYPGSNRISNASLTGTPRPSNSLSIPPQPAVDFPGKLRWQSYTIPQQQQDLWNQDRVSRGQVTAQTSPTLLFGGVDSLIQDSQDWWDKDQSQLHAHWNSEEHDATMMGPNGLNAGIQTGYGGPGYPINGSGNFMPHDTIL